MFYDCDRVERREMSANAIDSDGATAAMVDDDYNDDADDDGLTT